jgi:hypothetical protein
MSARRISSMSLCKTACVCVSLEGCAGTGGMPPTSCKLLCATVHAFFGSKTSWALLFFTSLHRAEDCERVCVQHTMSTFALCADTWPLPKHLLLISEIALHPSVRPLAARIPGWPARITCSARTSSGTFASQLFRSAWGGGMFRNLCLTII